MKKMLAFLALMLVSFTANAQTYSYDVNHDGEITIQDVMCIVNKILGFYNPGEAPLCPDSNHPHMIDLGLPSGTKWACCNIGANMPEEYGGHYAWGETEVKDYYDWTTYFNCDGSQNTCYNLGNDIAGTQYDVAHVKWGGNWQIPSSDQEKELVVNCTHIWTTINGIWGRKFIGPKGSSIFMPAAGCYSPNFRFAGSSGHYWSSTQYNKYNYGACSFYLPSNYASSNEYSYRSTGNSVRPVWVEY